ncbi:CHAT domain-containing protein [Suillus placidus]|uniref:CHAT domain-containing protein n=1 Tax=Suillus placidus TaxID=48579 RepID=A0A9P7D201_9AGAM|nr:CHAT domain-containing protein [Suillus placidus]
MSGSSESQFIKLEVIKGKNLKIPSCRMPAGIFISINVDSRRCWKSAISVLSSNRSAAWGDTVTLSSQASPVLSVEIRASYEAGRMLGSGEVIGKLQISWDELLNHGDEPFDISFPPVRDVHPSLMLKATVVYACDDHDGALTDSLADCEIARDTDAGHAQFAEYATSDNISHLNAAVEHFQLVLDQCPVDHLDHATALTNLACACLEGCIQNHLQDVDTTSLFREALALRPQGHPDHVLSLFNLIIALNWRYSKESTAVYIHESAELCCMLLSLYPEGTYLRSISVDIVIDHVIDECYKLPIDTSNEGINLRRVVLKLCPQGHQRHPRALYRLLKSLHMRFKQYGNIDDLDESIRLGREGVAMLSEGHLDRGSYLNELAISLVYRFDHLGEPNDLDEAISLHEGVLCLWPVGHEYHCHSLNSLGEALLARFYEHGKMEDIHRAVSLRREVLTLHPLGHPLRHITLNNLASGLTTRYYKSHVSEDLDEAIDRSSESLQLARHDHPQRHDALHVLSSALSSRFTQTGKNEDVDEAIQLCQEALASLPSLHPARFSSYQRLNKAYLARYRELHDPADLSLAVENFRLASGHTTRGFRDRVEFALLWVHEAEGHQHDSVLDAYRVCLELFDNHVMTRSSTILRRKAAVAFSDARSLAVDAASCAIRCDELRCAVELAEQGRGQQWSLASLLKTPVQDLESANPTLAHNYLKLSKLISNAAQSSATITDSAAADRTAPEYRGLTRQLEAAVAEIRNLRAFSRFLLPPLYEDLQVAACQGPIIILIASQYSRSAIIVPTLGNPYHIPLPVTLTDLNNLKDRFASAISQACTMDPNVPRNDLIVLLRIVWDKIMLPIVNVLEHVLKVERRSRIWLCPTAAFMTIPLHAAHPFQTKADRSKEPCLEDLYICSYTPTLSALIRSRQMMKQRLPPSFVAIGQSQPGAGKGKALLAVDSELELVRKLVPATANRTTISGDAATRAGALEALEENTWVHLACHGKQDPAEPYNSHFVMRDDHLTLLDIMEKDIPHAEFAFLSACHTAVGDEETPDEVIHLAAGLQFSGFKSVVGTLWGVEDAVAQHVVKAFYENMFMDLKDGGIMDCTKAACALNRATHAVKTIVPLEQKIVFIHIGV